MSGYLSPQKLYINRKEGAPKGEEMPHKYSEEFKESIIKKMMPPNPVSLSQLVKETGVSDVTLYKWRKDYRNQGIAAYTG